MPVKAYKVGPGTLTFGESGTSRDFSAQVTSCRVEWSEDVEDGIPVLSGEELAGAASYTATLAGTFVQDITDAGLAEWTWTEKGKLHPFTYRPEGEGAGKASFSGTVRIKPLDVGGDVKSQPTSDFEYACIGEPVMAHGI